MWVFTTECLPSARYMASLKTVNRDGNPQQVPIIINVLLVVVKTRTYFSECTIATQRSATKAINPMAETFTKKRPNILTTSLLRVSKITLQIILVGKCPQVTLRSAAAKERTNQLAVVRNLLLLAMIKITQLFPTKLKRVKNEKNTLKKSILYWWSH